MMVRAEGRFSGASPSQSYADGSTTTLFIAVAVLLPVRLRSVTAIVFRHNDTAAVWVEQYFGRIKAHPYSRIAGTLSAITVDLSRPHARTNTCQ